MKYRLLVVLLGFAAIARADSPLQEAIKLFDAKRYPEARAEFEKIATAEPANAAACYYLGMTLLRRGDGKALDDAAPWLEKAVTLEPDNARYLADFGGVSMSLAGKTRSLGAATKGRDAMEKSLKLEPDNLDAREGLYRFYNEAPWPLGSSAKAGVQLEEIRKRNPRRATGITLADKVTAKQYDEAFKICEELLAQNPDDIAALWQYGRTASTTGRNLERGLTALQRLIVLASTAPNTPRPLVIWNRIGDIDEKLGHPSEAKAAYEAVLKIEPGNKTATDALARMKP